MKFRNRISNRGLVVAFALFAAAFFVVGVMGAQALVDSNAVIAAAETASLENNETMPNFFAGTVVQSEYEQGFFVGTPVSPPGGFPSGQAPPQLGVAPTVFPQDPTDIPNFYVLVPAWGCDDLGGGFSCGFVKALTPAYAVSFAPQEICPPATIQTCWDHPSTIGVPNALLGGTTGFTTFPLPGHDHLIETLASFHDVWWKIIVVPVFNEQAWPNLAGTHGITSSHNLTANPVHSGGFVTESLDQAELDGDVFGEVVTNTFLNFANLHPGQT